MSVQQGWVSVADAARYVRLAPEVVRAAIARGDLPAVVKPVTRREGRSQYRVALADVEKGINMFRNENVNRQIYGLVENMAWFTPAEHPDEKYFIFGKDGGARLAEQFGVELLGRIPLVQGIRESGDQGEPAALGSGPDGLAFLELAGRLAEKAA